MFANCKSYYKSSVFSIWLQHQDSQTTATMVLTGPSQKEYNNNITQNKSTFFKFGKGSQRLQMKQQSNGVKSRNQGSYNEWTIWQWNTRRTLSISNSRKMSNKRRQLVQLRETFGCSRGRNLWYISWTIQKKIKIWCRRTCQKGASEKWKIRQDNRKLTKDLN